ncbi:MAG: hypothetical protein LBB59_02975 [Campylobacteraceae bacterium]|jgi:hypothetical protein|nr:hypothetical protein [Campylobacteraceae bacterium]
MKKFIKIFLLGVLILVVLIVALVYVLLFTEFGNGILKPIIEEKAKEASGIDIRLEKFYLRFSSIDVEAVVLESVKAKASGGINLFKQSFDINYSVNADKLPEMGGIKINEPLALNGNAAGGLKDININGTGDIFGAALNFDAVLKDFKPATINIDANKLKLAKVLAILGQPIYADGLFSAKIHINPNEKNELDGDALLHVDNGAVYKNTLKKEFNLTLKDDISYKMSADLKLSNSQDLVGVVELASSLANLKASDLKVNINTFNISSAYKLDIPNLKQLETLAGMALQGAVSLHGNVKYANGKIAANINSDNFAGGKLAAKLDDDKLDASLANAKISEILNTLVMPSYANANLNLKAQFSSLANQVGAIDADLTNGLVNAAVMKKEFNITLPKTDFSAKTNIVMNKNNIKFDMKFLSTLLNLEKFDGVFDTAKTELKSIYAADIKDLSKFDGITGQKMKGSIAVEGEADYKDKMLKVSGKSNVAGGNINFDFVNNTAKINGANLSTLELLKMLSYPQIFDAKIKLDADYNVNTSKGNFKAESPSGHITQTQLGDLVKTFLNFDMSKEAYENILLDGNIDNGKIKFLFDAKSKKVSLNVPEGKITDTVLDIPLKIQIEKTDINGKITGTTDKPKVSVDSSKYLQDKAAKEINRYLDKNSDKINKALDKIFK